MTDAGQTAYIRVALQTVDNTGTLLKLPKYRIVKIGVCYLSLPARVNTAPVIFLVMLDSGL